MKIELIKRIDGLGVYADVGEVYEAEKWEHKRPSQSGRFHYSIYVKGMLMVVEENECFEVD